MSRTNEHLASDPSAARWRSRGLAALLGLLAGTALAQPVPSAQLDRLSAQAAATGSARVIVGLKMPVAGPALAGAPGRQAALQRQVSIRAAQDAAIGELLAGSTARVVAKFDTVPHVAAEVDVNTLARLRASKRVASLQEDIAVPPTLLQSTAQVRATTAWDSGRTGSGWSVAVLDTGVDKSHPFLAGKVVSEACYSSTTTQSSSVCPGGATSSTASGSGVNCSLSISGCNHGTHVAGIVAGSGAPDGSHGVARGAGVIAIQVFSHFPAQGAVMSYTSDQIKGLERVYALRDTYPIASVNMSLGGGQYTSACDASQPALKAAIDNLRAVGIATVIASGNDGWRSAMSAPACISSAVSVGSVCDSGPDAGACGTGAGGVASYSNITSFVSVLAPGSLITSSVPGGGYATLHGTSMATPHVAGAWALMKQAQPTMSVDDGLALLRANGVATTDTRSGGLVGGLPRMDLGFLAGNAYALTATKSGTGSGTVSSAPSGIQCGSDCREPYAEGTTVTLNPSAAVGSVFAGWSGACSGTGACTLAMTEARDVDAAFNAVPYALSVTRAGTGSGTVGSAPAGIACGSTCSFGFDYGQSVTITAAPATGSRFTGWSGACTGTATTCTLSMTAARSVTASFALQSYAVTVARSGTGTGSVVSSPTGLSCGSTCTVTRSFGSAMTLTATPAAQSAFAGWTGACSGTGPCSVTVAGATSVGAVFTRTHNTLSVTRSGTGTVTSSPAGIACGSTCSAALAVDATVTLAPTPADGWRFTGWSGACTGAEACSVSMDAARSVTATFVRITYALAVTKVGTGDGAVTSSGTTAINCGSTCSALLASGTSVTLAARPASGSVFSGWSGACSGTGTCTVAMAEAKNVTASFTRTHVALAATRAGTGTGTVVSAPAAINCGSACSAMVPLDTPVTLTATAAAESVFAGWAGDCSGTETCSVTMSAARSVAATFTRTHYTLTVTRAGTGSGAVAADGSGIDCGGSCRSSLPLGTQVTLVPTPATGSRFAGWTGACTGTGACTVTMSAARSVGATFTLLSYAVGVTRDGTGVGTVVSSPSGLSCGSTCSVLRTHGSTMTLTATPAAGSAFAGWGGACSGTGTCSVLVTSATAVSATFTLTHQRLAVTRSGSGTVSSTPAAIACGSTCSALVPLDGTLTLSAAPAAEYAFTGWGGACTGTDDCTLAMSAARSASATFTRSHYTLALTLGGTGAGRVASTPEGVDCGASCRTSLPIGTVLSLTPTPTEGSVFAGWSGACTGTGACSVTLSAARSVTATFTRILYSLAVTKNGSATGTVVSSPTGLSCGTVCSKTFPSGTPVTLTATPASGKVFAGWSGACTGTGACVVPMSAATSVAATFNAP